MIVVIKISTAHLRSLRGAYLLGQLAGRDGLVALELLLRGRPREIVWGARERLTNGGGRRRVRNEVASAGVATAGTAVGAPLKSR